MSESGKVIVTKSKLDGLANAINNKAQSPGPKTIAQLTQTVNDMKTGGSSVFLVTLTTDLYDLDNIYDVGQVTADKSFTEICTAYKNGNIVRAQWGGWSLALVDIENDFLMFAACDNTIYDSDTLVSVTAGCSSGETTDNWQIGYWTHHTPTPADAIPKAPGTATPGKSSQYAREDHVHPKELPDVTATDNGKFLRVVSGAWAAVEIANANGGSF